jgi:hypothetical protein
MVTHGRVDGMSSLEFETVGRLKSKGEVVLCDACAATERCLRYPCSDHNGTAGTGRCACIVNVAKE